MRKYILTILSLLIGLVCFAQQTELPSNLVEVIKEFDARLAVAKKWPLMASIPAPDTSTQLIGDYRLSVLPSEITYPEPVIRPLSIALEDRPAIYHAYLKGGYGFPNMPYAEGAYFWDSGNDFNVDLFGRYHSAKAYDHDLKKHNDWQLGARTKFLVQSGIMASGGFSYLQKDRYRYGVDPVRDSLVTDDESRRRFKVVHADLSISNDTDLESAPDYKAGFSYDRIADDQATQEDNISLALNALWWFDGSHPIRLEYSSDFTTLTDTVERSLNIHTLSPSFQYIGDKVSIKAGIRASASDDNFFFHPLLEANIDINQGNLIAYGGVDGTLIKNSYLRLSSENPYISSRIDSLAYTKSLMVYGGIKGQSGKIQYDGKAGWKQATSLPLYINQPGDSLAFSLLFDDVDIIFLEAALEAGINDRFSMGLQLYKPFYYLSSEPEAWHLPDLELKISGTYRSLDDRLIIKGVLFLENGVPYLSTEGINLELDGLVDLSVHADYRISDQLSLFAELNNIANQERERWFRYPTYGINGLLGLSARW